MKNTATWILHDSKYSCFVAENQSAGQDLFPQAGLHITRVEAEFQLSLLAANYQSKKQSRALGEEESTAFLFKTLHSLRGKTPNLWQEVSALASKNSLVPEGVYTLKRFIDEARQFERKENILVKAIEESEFLIAGSVTTEELLHCLDSYELAMEEEGCYDRIGLRTKLLDTLGLKHFLDFLGEEILPAQIFLNNPSWLTPLESSIWLTIAPHSKLELVVDSSLVEFSQSSTLAQGGFDKTTTQVNFTTTPRRELSRFIQAKNISVNPIEPISSYRDSLVLHLIEGEDLAPLEASEVPSLIASSDRRDEVRQVVSEISQLLASSEAKATDIQIIASDLEPYIDLLRVESELAGIPVCIPRGAALSSNLAADSVLCFFQWLDSGSLESLDSYFRSDLVKKNIIDRKDFGNLRAAFPEEHSQLTAWLEESEISVDGLGDLVDAVDALGFRKAGATDSSWISALLSSLARLSLKAPTQRSLISKILAQLALYYREVSWRDRLFQISAPAEIAAMIRERLFRDRSKIRYSGIDSNTQVKIASAYRKIFNLERTISRMQALIAEHLATEDQPTVSLVINLWSRLITQTNLREQLTRESISCTELSDVRGIRNQYSFLIGLTRDVFPRTFDVNEVRNQFGIALKVAGKSWPDSFESFVLLRHVFSSSRELYLSAPRSGEGKQLEPTGIYRECLSRYGAKERITIEQKKAPVGRSVELLKARASAAYTEYDGVLQNPKKLEALLEKRQILERREGGVVAKYSPTLLERYVGCPQSFFFSDVLGLKVQSHPLEFLPSLEIGNLLHAVLEKVYQEFLEVEKLPELDELSRRALVHLNEAVEESVFDWQGSVLRRLKLEYLSRGLNQEGDRSRRGLLKAALVFHLDLLKSTVKTVEYPFGFGENKPLCLEAGGGNCSIEIRGKIDRIDQIISGQTEGKANILKWAVWDYKTGNTSRFIDVKKGVSLQVPIYGAVLAQHFGVPAEDIRGGQIALKRPDRRDELLSSLTEGVVIEHLAVAKKGRSYVFDWQAAPSVIDESLDYVREYSDGIIGGSFPYAEDFQAILQGGFHRISYRNPVKLTSPEEVESISILEWNADDSEGLESESSEASSFSLTREQSLASDPHKSFLLRASAGSGKTHVLRSRFVNSIFSGVPIEKIVAITFTDKAASEIKTRVERILQKILIDKQFDGQEIDSPTLNLVRRALADISKARISTIHSFARSILRMDPVLARGLSEAETLGETEQKQMIEIALEEVVEESKFFSRVKLLVNSGISERVLHESVRRLVLDRRKFRFVSAVDWRSGNGNSSPPKEYLESIEQVYAELSVEVRENFSRKLLALLEQTKEWLANNPGLADEKRGGFEKLLPTLAELLSSLKLPNPGGAQNQLFKAREVLEQYSGSAVRVSKKNPVNYWKAVRDLLSSTEAQIFSYGLTSEPENFQLAEILIEISEKVFKAYQKQKKLIGVVDFDDLLESALAMIQAKKEDEPWLATRKAKLLQRIQSNIDSMMVDEFQDTDQTQWQIISLLAEREEATDCPLFLVGDTQQSIYGFRGGDSSVFIASLDLIERKSGEELALTYNFRSHPGVIKFVNSFFPRLFSLDFYETGKARVRGASTYLPMKSFDEDQSESSDERVLVYQQKFGSSMAAEAAALGDKVVEILEAVQSRDGSWPALESKHGNLLAVLLRKRTELMAVARAFDLRGIPYQISKSSIFYDLDEVVQFENLLRLLVDQKDEVALVGVLRSALFGFSDDDLANYFLDGDGAVREQVSLWIEWSQFLPISSLLERIASNMNLKESYFEAGMEGAWDNILGLIDLFKGAELSGESRGTPHSSLEWLLKQKLENKVGPELSDSNAPVILSTIHASKGLEFPMVILPMLDQSTNRTPDFIVEDPALVVDRWPLLGVKVEDPTKDFKRSKTLSGLLCQRQASLLENSESRRVFYVACTRAEEYLILFLRELSSKTKEVGSLDEKENLARDSGSPAVWIRALGVNLFN